MNQINKLGRRAFFASVALLLGAALTLPTFISPSSVSADQVATRSITMSSSAPSAAATYKLKFTPVTTEQVLIVDFCSNSPLVADTCSFSGATVPTIGSVASDVGTASALSTHTIKVTGLTMTGGSSFTINFTAGITNPTTAASFYARILTYSTANANVYVPAASTGGTATLGAGATLYQDYGGDALSTANNVSITAKVFETLSFCVYMTTCSTAPNISLGDSSTGALSSGTSYVNSDALYDIATNAGSGVSVSMTGHTLCRSGTPGDCTTGAASPYTITSIGATSKVSAKGSEQFGMCVDTVGGNGGLAAPATYSDSGTGNCDGITDGPFADVTHHFGFDETAANSAAGSVILTSTGAVSSYTKNFTFLGNISNTTEAGLYTTALNLVATATF